MWRLIWFSVVVFFSSSLSSTQYFPFLSLTLFFFSLNHFFLWLFLLFTLSPFLNVENKMSLQGYLAIVYFITTAFCEYIAAVKRKNTPLWFSHVIWNYNLFRCLNIYLINTARLPYFYFVYAAVPRVCGVVLLGVSCYQNKSTESV